MIPRDWRRRIPRMAFRSFAVVGVVFLAILIHAQTLSGDEPNFSVFFLGDTHLGDNYASPATSLVDESTERQSGFDAFKELEPLLSSNNRIIVNLETPLCLPTGETLKTRWIHWTRAEKTLAALKRLNVTAISLGNNHSGDQGPTGLLKTMDLLEREGMAVFGAGRDAAEASRPYWLHSSNDDDERPPIAVIGGFEHRPNYEKDYSYYATSNRAGVALLNGPATSAIIAKVKTANPNAIVIVFPHWGKNYSAVKPYQRRWARSWIRAGADVIIGHGAHLWQTMERIEGRPVLHNIGNFLFNSPGRYQQTDRAPVSFVAELVVKANDVGLLRLRPILSDNAATNYRPRPLKSTEFDDWFAQFNETLEPTLKKDLETRCDETGGRYLELPFKLRN